MIPVEEEPVHSRLGIPLMSPRRDGSQTPRRSGIEGPIRLGVVGTSPGNGHPYSWSAIFNGYDADLMAQCPYPVIPEYLSKHAIGNGAIDGATVTHVWSQDSEESEAIAAACRIEFVSPTLTELVRDVDAVLVARDDPESHPPIAALLMQSMTPGFVDKPFAISGQVAREMFSWDPLGQFLFTCTSMRYASELVMLAEMDQGSHMQIEGLAPKSWDLYSVHVIEPILRFVPSDAVILDLNSDGVVGGHRRLVVTWSSGQTTVFKTTGESGSPIAFTVDGQAITPSDTFTTFRNSLAAFVAFLRDPSEGIPHEETLRVIDLIEQGRA